MNIVDILESKRYGSQLSQEQIGFFVREFVRKNISDAQAAALLMAICCQGMNRQETIDLTNAMADSGHRIDLDESHMTVFDKHSCGGVGDTTTIVTLPLVASLGIKVGKMSGRGLGILGGTLDKMESISGWSGALTLEKFTSQLDHVGFVLAGQSDNLAPADRDLYALRDVTGTVSSIPLIASSIMSKKLAAGAHGFVLDVMVGPGAFLQKFEQGKSLAKLMIDIASAAQKDVTAIISSLHRPLGRAVGNAVEVREAIQILRGNAGGNLWEHCLTIGSHLLLTAGRAQDLAGARKLLVTARDSGAGLEKLREMVVAQGGDGSQIDNSARIPSASVTKDLRAERTGYISRIDARSVGRAVFELGAGRTKKDAPIDHSVGVEIPVRLGDWVNSSDVLCTIHARDESDYLRAETTIRNAITMSENRIEPESEFLEIISTRASSIVASP